MLDQADEQIDQTLSLITGTLDYDDFNTTKVITATATITAAHPAAQIVIVSNYDEEDLRAAARTAGACGYVTKQNLLELTPLLGRLGLTSGL